MTPARSDAQQNLTSTGDTSGMQSVSHTPGHRSASGGEGEARSKGLPVLPVPLDQLSDVSDSDLLERPEKSNPTAAPQPSPPDMKTLKTEQASIGTWFLAFSKINLI